MEELILSEYRKSNNFGRLMGMDFTISEDGSVVYSLIISKDHLATPSTAHGGVIAAYADAVLGVGALIASAANGNIVSTIEFKISYFQPVKIGDTIIGTTTLLKSGKSIIFMEGEMRNDKNELVAKANGTFNQYPAEKIFNAL